MTSAERRANAGAGALLSEHERVSLGQIELTRRAQARQLLEELIGPSLFLGQRGNRIEAALDDVIHGAMQDTVYALQLPEQDAEVASLHKEPGDVLENEVRFQSEERQGE